MRNASTALKNLLGSATEIAVCDLLTLVLADGTIVRLTSADQNMTAVSQYDNASHTFLCGIPGQPPFTRGRTKLVRGLQVDTLDLTLHARPGTDLIEGINWPQAAATGLLDNAVLVLEKLLMASFSDTSAGTLIQFWGRVGQLEPTRTSVKCTVESLISQLRRAQLPRSVYQPTCLHTVYDTGCTLLKSTFQVSGACTAGSTTSAINTNLTQADSYFDLGYLTFTSGALNGLKRLVQHFTHTSGVVQVTPPFGVAPATGDTFTIVPGCDKTQATCTNKFSNLAHFRGFPYVPQPETAR